MFYHGCEERFDENNIELTRGNNAGSVLGLWVSHDLRIAKNFGPHVLSLGLDYTTTQLALFPVEEFYNAYVNKVDFAPFRNLLLSKGMRFLDIVENDGEAVTGVILDTRYINYRKWL